VKWEGCLGTVADKARGQKKKRKRKKKKEKKRQK